MMTLYPYRNDIKNFVEEFNDKKVIVEYNVLDQNHLTDSSTIWFFGIFPAIIVICLELIYNKFKKIIPKVHLKYRSYQNKVGKKPLKKGRVVTEIIVKEKIMN